MFHRCVPTGCSGCIHNTVTCRFLSSSLTLTSTQFSFRLSSCSLQSGGQFYFILFLGLGIDATVNSSSSAPVDPTAPNFHSVSTNLSEGDLFGELEQKDTEWLCAGGFVTETQTFYIVADDGTSIMCQIIHSSVGYVTYSFIFYRTVQLISYACQLNILYLILPIAYSVWYPTIQFTCKIADPTKGEKIWKSINVNNFVTPPPGHDKRSSKADEYSVLHKSTPGTDTPEKYVINANLGVDLQVSLEISRPASIPGYKVGKGPKGGYSYFGTDTEKAEGYVIHRFWPRARASGHIIKGGKAETVQGSAMFVHAIQGMRPNLVASRWNFAHFQSEQLGGVSGIQMEFTTLDTHGQKGAGSGGVSVNVGSLVIGDKLATVTASTKWPGEEETGNVVSRATHLEPENDPETGYAQPTKIRFEWKGPSVVPDVAGYVEGKLEGDLGSVSQPKGLIEKVDVLAEIPYVLKMAVNYVAGTKPYIYQWSNPAKLSITGPDALAPGLSSGFHSTPRRQGLPLIPFFASMLKASAGLELARTAGRIALTFIPVLWLGNMKAKKMFKYAAVHGIKHTEEKKQLYIRRMRRSANLAKILFAIPMLLFWATLIAGLERTPLTGRWRLILLSPEEEDEIANQLAGPGWYQSVGQILAEDGHSRVLPTSDWRYKWVSDTLRQLEASIPVLSREPELCPHWKESGGDCKPLPPPADYPLQPRPRASEYLRWFCDRMTKKDAPASPIPPIPGPPYSLLVVDKPDSSNAFSYGFGPDGGSGIVVYSGFLDEIFTRKPLQYAPVPQSPRSFWGRLLGGLFPTSPQLQPAPTADQTAELAILLAHEMAHLLLSHHLESLSSATVIVPGTLSIVSDIIRVVIFPITMLFGPFVNDGVAQLGKIGSGELSKLSEQCTNFHQETEADIVSARILAHAGFDARDAIKFWENRANDGDCARASTSEMLAGEPSPMKYARSIVGDSHPLSEMRVQSLKKELERWEKERTEALDKSRTGS
ncbi:hypothetical protein CVT24_000334 [Panaeolus cyanescens]|uniref:Peptidase M48 domain-containing protein n=1 Tax=Panaeolus cyanescens TaxID=181874 RepID=A0A409VIX7_9AGAR|nr:hypothetical protein CVT24_000334 [Panaeolus cyanescens]